MHDIKAVRANPDAFDNAMRKRGEEATHSAAILTLDGSGRKAQTELQELQQQANAVAKEIGAKKKNGENADDAIAASSELKKRIAALKAAIAEGEGGGAHPEELTRLLQSLPNIPHASVPEGPDESGNVEVKKHGEPHAFSFTPKPHWELGERDNMLDFAAAAAMSGARFSVLRGRLAKLERALEQFLLDMHTDEHGYTEISPPLLVRDEAMFGTGQLPKFGEDSFSVSGGYRLIPTAEVSLTNLVRETILPQEALPLRFCAATPCFRSEAGAAGRDTRGLIRQHQFRKVELVSVTLPDDSYDELERMTRCAETALERLELPYRRMLLCTGDTGFSAAKTYDLEVWLPSENTYREISSCSNCEAFQARRMRARYRAAEKQTGFVHTLNGSALAAGRCLIALLENFQQQDGTITIPDALRPYFGAGSL